MELVFLFAIVMLLLLGVILFIAVGMYYRGFRDYTPPLTGPDGRLIIPPPTMSERPRDANWHGV